MLVEDEVLIGLMLAKKLRSFGYVVGEVATTGEEAIKRTGLEKPEVILMDVTLAGEMSGLEAARQIRTEYGTSIIVFSGYDDKSLYEQAEQAGAVAVLAKMAPISEIAAAIEEAVGRKITKNQSTK